LKFKDFIHKSDSEILLLFYSTYDSNYIGILLERYTMLLFGVCMKYLKNKTDAHDAVQQVYLKALAELPKYKVEFIKSWLYMVAKNQCLTVLKANKKTIYNEDVVLQHEDVEDHELVQKMKQHDISIDLMHSCMQELGEEQAKCVTLFYLEKKSYATIEAATGFTYLQVKSFIQNGKRNLKNLLEKKMRTLNNV
jgi:RNA polymerase sigma factor (sigma-70 family)